MNDPKGALAVWNALAGKVRQLIRDQTKSAVRKKKMNIAAISTANQTVTVYEASDPTKTITVPYRAGQGIEALSAGQSVIVEWIYDDLSTAVAATPGQGWTTPAGARASLGIYTGQHASNTSAAVTVPSGTITNLCSVTLPEAGTYIVIGNVNFGSNATGYRAAAIPTDASSLTNVRGQTIRQNAVDGAVTMMNMCFTFNVSSAQTRYLNVQHNAGTDLNVSGSLYYIRIS